MILNMNEIDDQECRRQYRGIHLNFFLPVVYLSPFPTLTLLSMCINMYNLKPQFSFCSYQIAMLQINKSNTEYQHTVLNIIV